MSGRKQIATTYQVTPEFLEDVAGAEKLIAEQMKSKLAVFAESEGLLLEEGTFKMERQEGGFWVERDRTWWQRLLRRPPQEDFVRVVDFRAWMWGYET